MLHRLILMSTMDDIGSDGLGIFMIEHAFERSHAGILHRAVEHDLVPELVGEEARSAQVRNCAAANGRFAMAGRAVAAEEVIAVGDGRGIRRRGGGGGGGAFLPPPRAGGGGGTPP